jgi:uncharacterized membrane protein YfcA
MKTPSKAGPLVALLYSVPIAIAGGLIGLGGAEYRLPVLKGPMHYTVKEAVPINLAVSLVTLVVSFITRVNALSLNPIVSILPVILSLIAGAVVAAFVGTAFFKRLSERRLERLILFLLIGIGSTLIVESFLPQKTAGFVPSVLLLQVIGGIMFGLGIGLVSSVLGVAGGELIIPTLIFGYGVGIKTAGTASLIVSLPTVTVGLVRYAMQGRFEREHFVDAITPMGIGSAIGAIVGGLLVGVFPEDILKLILGIILILSALRIFTTSPNAGATGPTNVGAK